jgi:hypothetical protein
MLLETKYLDFGVSPQVVGVRIEQGVFFLASTFDGRKLIFCISKRISRLYAIVDIIYKPQLLYLHYTQLYVYTFGCM